MGSSCLLLYRACVPYYFLTRLPVYRLETDNNCFVLSFLFRDHIDQQFLHGFLNNC